MMKKSAEGNFLAGLLRAFSYAASGVAYCFRTQRNLRIHAVAGVLALAAGFRLGLTGAEMGVLTLTIAAVLVAEMFNTAVEALVDIVSPGYHPLAKVAKDVAAGGVLVVALMSLVVAYVLFAPRIM
ncbi:diacylglycerol kinase family protein [Anaeroselena agilis]|uniref:Diacylglycerol kinase family protein n=1 Tax=Anaeroselena agilis TaxID=3063788 RepID=A0ABU3NYR9_9FIRM|nr:diacylglycerol kinase family protein [Selenomonadales bacterium 4137-cl]